MAILSVTTLNTAAVTIGSGDTLIVTALGALFTEGGDAASGTGGSATLTVLGAIASGEGDGIDLNDCTAVDINIGAAGFVGSNADNAVEVQSDLFILRNSGTIQGDTRAVHFTGTARGPSTVEIHNTGDLIGGITANFGTTQGGTLSLFNSGTISGRDFAISTSNADQVSIVNSGVIGDPATDFPDVRISIVLSGNGILVNSGTIFGNVQTFFGSISVWNTGFIDGDLNGSTEGDFFDLRGGQVTGAVNGGGGNDTYFVDSSETSILDGGQGGFDVIWTSVSYALVGSSIENLYLQGVGAVEALGSNGANSIIGSQFDNRLFGRGGNDTLASNQLFETGGDDLLAGGAGDDRLIVRGEGNCTVRGGGGVDWLEFSSSLAPDLRIDLVAGVVQAFGETDDQHVIMSIEAVIGGNGNDTMIGGAGQETLLGGDGNDRLGGGGGVDRLDGGSGIDTLVGGALDDTFVFANVAHLGVGLGLRDVITDFKLTEIIDLALIDAVGGGPDNAFTFVGTATLTGGAGRLRYEQFVAENFTVIEGDVNGDGGADFQIQLGGLLVLTAGQFVL